MGVDCALAGSSTVQTSLPVSASNACRYGSSAAAVKTKPPAVAIGPPKLIDPGGAPSPMLPSGASHRSLPVFKSNATSAPHGGGLQGNPDGDTSQSRCIPYGVPLCGANSPRHAISSVFSRAAGKSARGIRFATAATRLVLASRLLRTGSHAALPQFTPPMLPGYEIVPLNVGGVNRPSLR